MCQLGVTRRCNLSCGYCTEYDTVSPPIPAPVLKRRIDAVHALGTLHICLLGGEPLLHPELSEVVAHASRHALTSVITNGFLLSDELVDALNDSGLFAMKVSVDAFTPDATLYIQKTWKTVKRKLERLASRARFRVLVSSVLCEHSKDSFREMVDETRRLGLPLAVSIVHDESGAVGAIGDEYVALYDYYREQHWSPLFVEYEYGRELLRGNQPTWKCRAGARYLYVDESGQLQLCPAQRGALGKHITDYTARDMRRAYATHKECEAGCSVMCVYRASAIDNAPLQTARTLVRNLLRSRQV